jgi:hypothetical protein
MAELKRRNVIRVVIAYVAGAWLLTQISDILFPIYVLSDSILQILTTLLLIGLIPVLVLSWPFLHIVPRNTARQLGYNSAPVNLAILYY